MDDPRNLLAKLGGELSSQVLWLYWPGHPECGRVTLLDVNFICLWYACDQWCHRSCLWYWKCFVLLALDTFCTLPPKQQSGFLSVPSHTWWALMIYAPMYNEMASLNHIQCFRVLYSMESNAPALKLIWSYYRVFLELTVTLKQPWSKPEPNYSTSSWLPVSPGCHCPPWTSLVS